jgi:hypothetical protein
MHRRNKIFFTALPSPAAALNHPAILLVLVQIQYQWQ